MSLQTSSSRSSLSKVRLSFISSISRHLRFTGFERDLVVEVGLRAVGWLKQVGSELPFLLALPEHSAVDVVGEGALVSCGGQHTVFAEKGGMVMFCGFRYDGDDVAYEDTPVRLEGIDDVVQASAGSFGTCFLVRAS